ncbi:ABC transporter substrate-binding protein [Salinarimonas rosea]|uniref:ABC transporter substrate-binding protein n=1 Tax=Salinarimonas rosea TaxID=552063 RepID=UPI000402F68D|nr:ABC transporter substrate-binding protein [Salinarimonas rosea]
MPIELDRRLFTLGLGTSLVAGAAGMGRARAASGRVVVGTWGGDYQGLQQRHIVDPLLTPQGVDVVFDTANDTVRRTKLMSERRLPRGSMDVACLTNAGSYQMAANGVFDEIDEDRVPNLKHVLPKLRTSYSAPHIYTGRVILYNPEIITKAPTSYADLWNPEYAGKVGVIDIQYQTTIESAAMIAGGSLSDYEPGKDKLLELKEMGVRIYPTNEAMAQALASGECAMCIMWQARGNMWKRAGLPIEIAIPEEGVVLYVSDMSVPKNARNKDAAYAYLNAMLDPGPQRAFAEAMGYAPTIDNADLPPELAKEVALPPEVQDSFLVQDQEYLLENDAQLQDWWNRVFKA